MESDKQAGAQAANVDKKRDVAMSAPKSSRSTGHGFASYMPVVGPFLDARADIAQALDAHFAGDSPAFWEATSWAVADYAFASLDVATFGVASALRAPMAAEARIIARAEARAALKGGQSPQKFVRDFSSENTKDLSARFKSEGEARSLARTKLGRNPTQVAPGKLRSADGRWQYRGKPEDLRGHGPSDSPHVHLERLDPTTGEVLENWHLRW
jgi:hypothetical protein